MTLSSRIPASSLNPIAAIALSFALVACQTTGSTTSLAEAEEPVQVAAAAQPSEAPEYQGARIPDIPGPKRTVAVGKFTAIGAYTSRYGDWDIGGGLSAMLTTALVESGRFIVVERANLGQILTEQELKGSGVAQTGPALGQMAGVQLMVFGSVTEFGEEEEGGGLGVGLGEGTFGGLFSGALGLRGSSGAVAMDIRIVDTTTGRILETYRVKEPLEATGVDLSLGYGGISFGGDKFWKTPLGKASRRAVDRAVVAIASEAGEAPWVGRVVDIERREMYINAGRNSGLQVGDRFMIERVVKRLTDPQTGELLSVRKRELGTLQLTGVEPKISYGTYSPLAATRPKRGDLVMMIRGH